jgi:aspartate/methionine/tyrosine aminotransferase
VVDLAMVTPGCIRLEVGEPSFPTPSHIVNAAIEFARKGPLEVHLPVGIARMIERIEDLSASR